jgi:hypothetical protein
MGFYLAEPEMLTSEGLKGPKRADISPSASSLMSCRTRVPPRNSSFHATSWMILGPPSPTHRRYLGSATPFHVFLPLDPRTRAESYDTVRVSGNKRDSARERVNRLTIAIEASNT